MAVKVPTKKGQPVIVELTHKQMLEKIGGDGKFAAKDWRIRRALDWGAKAKSAIRHLLDGERKFSAQEERDVEAGYMRFCAALIKAHHEEDQKLIATIRSSLAYLESVDPDFHRSAIEALRSMAGDLGDLAGQGRPQDRGVGEA